VNPREEVLARIRAAVQDGTVQNGTVPPAGDQARTGPGSAAQPSPQPAPGYRERGDLDGPGLIDLLAERLADYRAAVRRAPAAGLAEAVATALTERAAWRVVVPPGLDLPALPDGVEAVTDDGLTADELDAFDGVITGAAVAIAETGTIILDGSPGQGRRAITLVPDYHLCLVHAAQVVELVPEAIARLAPRAGQPLTWISGPSATSDIELNRVEGVHGPRTLEVILVEPA
jgi:L-lactate dehydrogenase complex protein LldG